MLTSIYAPVKQAGNGAQVAFSGGFKILAQTDIVAQKIDASGATFTGALNVDYTVVFDPIQETWTVTWTVAPVSGGFSLISRKSDLTQGSTFPREGPAPAAATATAIDKAMMLIQELEQGSVQASTELSGAYASRPVLPLGGQTACWYYSTDRDSYEKWIPAAQKWILVG